MLWFKPKKSKIVWERAIKYVDYVIDDQHFTITPLHRGKYNMHTYWKGGRWYATLYKEKEEQEQEQEQEQKNRNHINEMIRITGD